MNELYNVKVGLELLVPIERSSIEVPDFPLISTPIPLEPLRDLEQHYQQTPEQFVPAGEMYFPDPIPRHLTEEDLSASIKLLLEQASEPKHVRFNPNFVRVLLFGKPILDLYLSKIVEALYRRVYSCDGAFGFSRFPNHSSLTLSGQKDKEVLEDVSFEVKGLSPPYDSLDDLFARSRL